MWVPRPVLTAIVALIAAAGSTSGAVKLWTKTISGEKDRYCGWPSVCDVGGGELAAVFSGDRNGHICPWGKVRIVRSSDGGETWSDSETVCNTILDDRDAGLLRLSNGDLVMFWFTSVAFYENEHCRTNNPEYARHFEKLDKDAVRRDLGSFSRRSTDGGRTWEAPVRMPTTAPHGGIQLSDGRLLVVGRQFPAIRGHLGSDPEEKAFESRGPELVVVESDDLARSWRVLARLSVFTNACEPHLVEAANGVLHSYMRTTRDLLHTESADGGKTWSPPARTGIPSWNNPPHLLRLRDGRVLLTYGRRKTCEDDPGVKTGVYARIGDANATPESYAAAPEIPLYLNDNVDLGYATSVENADGSILTVFYGHESENASILAVKWRPPAVVAHGAPVWVAGAEKEMNAFYGFAAEFDAKRGDRPTLRLSAGAIARVWVNGKFAGYGPARAPEGFMRVDEWPLGDFVVEGRNVVAIEVSNPAVNTFYLPEQSGYLDAEVVCGGRVLARTTAAGMGGPSAVSASAFKSIRLPRVKRTSRFSYQREFAEFYSVTPESYAWRTNGIAGAGLPLGGPGSVPATMTPLKPLPRGAPHPTFVLDGTFRPTRRTFLHRDPKRIGKPRSCVDAAGIGSFKGFAKEELDVNFSTAIQQLVADRIEPVLTDATSSVPPVGGPTSVSAKAGTKPGPPVGVRLKNLEGVVFEGARNTAGFPKLEVRCSKPTTLWLVMDELAGPDGLPDPVRYGSCVNACGWRLKAPGDYSLECFQPYGLKCAHVVVEGGEAEVLGFDLRTYLNPASARATFRCSDSALEKIFRAAAQSLACNAVDGFTDCPGRERGIYFGDTVFTARGADVLLGDLQMERMQFENYVLAPRFPDIPEGLIPMLYPGDTTLSQAHWIPNFCMWSVVQLADYVRRSGVGQGTARPTDTATMRLARPTDIVEKFRGRAEGILAWFRRSRNAEGLLENLPGWVFIEWSDADKFTKGINYPTNMLYVRFLDAFAELYGDESCRAEAARLRETIRRLSWNGEWFRDHSLREANAALTTPNDCTEICQYLAFFSGVATAERDPLLWRRLVEDMGPMRTAGAHPAIYRSNLLFGYSLRFVMLSEAGLSKKVLDEVKACYLPMAEKTGTLWEAMSSEGYSCCHGFPAMAAWLLARDALGVKAIDRAAKTVTVSPPAGVPLDWCEGAIPLPGGETCRVRWMRKDGKTEVSVSLPDGWRRAVRGQTL